MKMIAVILAGGTGPRLWPRSTEVKPKQFSHMTGDGTLLQNTLSRISSRFSTDDIYIVTNEEYVPLVKEQVPAINKSNIISEPFARHTAPALGLAQTIFHDKYDENTIVCVFPSDHVISNLGEFRESVSNAAEFAYKKDAIVTLGIKPSRPETQYGYVQIDEVAMADTDYFEKGIRICRNFAEKPDIGTAERFLESGDFYWNSGIFFWKIGVFYEKIAIHLPDHYKALKSLKKHLNTKEFEKELVYMYKQIDSISIDYGILEKADNVYVVKSSFEWNDIETWDELYRVLMKDAKGNTIEGDVIAINTKNSLISANEKMIGVVGVDNLIIIDTDNAILVCKRDESEKVQEIVDYMRRKNITKYL